MLDTSYSQEIIGEQEFFAPASTDAIDHIIGEYKARRAQVESVAELFKGDIGGVVHYFIEGNRAGDGSRYSSYSAEKIFLLEGAIAALNASYWGQALALTDVYDSMPQKRRDEWNESIRSMKTPEFTEENVRPTLASLLASREKFFAERVDGIFRGLSGHHVTNVPEGFGKRMIIGYVLDCYGYSNHSRAGIINDLRCVVAKFMGRDEPKHYASYRLIDALKGNWGQWISIDGGAIRVRLYKKGTAHLEVHPDMAWRLNRVLASMHPTAIPAEFRVKPKKPSKEFAPLLRPVPFAALDVLEDANFYGEGYMTVGISLGKGSEAVKEACRVLESIGGVQIKPGSFQFDYKPTAVIKEIILTGCLPDKKTHQFYPTPAVVAEAVIEAADISDAHDVLEPSAGIGGLADLLPNKERVTCVELSAIHCEVLKAKGFDTHCADFIQWGMNEYMSGLRFSRIVMNPPFSEGRAAAHVNAASELVEDGGRLVAVLPSSMRNKFTLDGFKCSWGGVYQNEFDGTGVSVSILIADK